MLKIFLYLLAALIVAVIIGSGIHFYRVSAKNKAEMAAFQGEKVTYNNHLGKILVVYYSLSGHTRDIAEKIQAFTNADSYVIKTAEPIKNNPALHFKVKQQLKTGQYPELVGEIPDFSGYDYVFVGAPVWWYTAATPMLSFLEQADFQGKKVVPFSTQGSNYGSFFEDFAAKAKNANIQEGASFNNLPAKYNRSIDNKIARWLNSLS